jgi:hypothetical protein
LVTARADATRRIDELDMRTGWPEGLLDLYAADLTRRDATA